MELPSILRHAKRGYWDAKRPAKNKGFTLIEILIAIAILALIVSVGLFISFDFYKSYAFRSERNIIVSVLQKARNQSLSNINQVRHGVHFQDNPLTYVMFECPSANPQCTSYIANPVTDIVVQSSYGVSINAPALPFDVIFNQLDASCASANCITNPLAITVSDSVKSYDIKINNEGQINW